MSLSHYVTNVTISNEEAFIKADVAAREVEKRIGRELSSDEYSEFVWWFMMELKNPQALHAPFDPTSK